MAWPMLPGRGGSVCGPPVGAVVSLREYVPSIEPWDDANRIAAELSIVGAQLERSTCDSKDS